MKSFAIRLLAVNLLLLGVAACDNDDRVVDRNVVVEPDNDSVQNVDECPRDDGQPCK